jgi:hypothetical protein
VVAADDAQLSKCKSSSDYDWYSPPLLLFFSFLLSLNQKVNPLAIMTGIHRCCHCFFALKIIGVVSITTCNPRRCCRTCDYAARACEHAH